jgi:hypothetical protein
MSAAPGEAAEDATNHYQGTKKNNHDCWWLCLALRL